MHNTVLAQLVCIHKIKYLKKKEESNSDFIYRYMYIAKRACVRRLYGSVC